MSFMKNTTLETFNNTIDSTNQLLQFSLWPLRIVCPLLVIVSPLANWICICVFQSRVYNRSSSKWYFIFIAIFDTIYVLVTAPLIFLITFQIYILNWNILFCKLIVFFNYLSCQISAGLLACLSIDRLIATSCISVYRHGCSTKVSKYVCLCVILTLSLINSHYLIGYTIDSDGYCSVRHYKWYGNIYSLLNIGYLLSYSIIPFTIISICNLFIVVNVCRNKSTMEKYDRKKPTVSINNQNEETMMVLPNCCLSQTCNKREDSLILNTNHSTIKCQPCSDENKHDMMVTIQEKQIISKILDVNFEMELQRQSRLSGKLLLNSRESINGTESSPSKSNPVQSSTDRYQPSYNQQLSTPASYSHKMCMQLQITISLLAISISFIFCTLPNCISTIRIQAYNNDEQVRKFWQAMNYLSIVPLLITHSVNLCFYYLSSQMFRNCFKDIYVRRTSAKKSFSLKTLLRS